MMRQVVILKSWALRRGLLGLALILGLLAAANVAVWAFPPVPQYFYGTAQTTTGVSLPQGTVVEARVLTAGGWDGRPSATVDSQGRYGYSPELQVVGNEAGSPPYNGARPGDQIGLFVNGIQAQLYNPVTGATTLTYPWSSGTSTRLDVKVNPVYTIAATAGAGGTLTPSGNVAVPFGANQAFAIAANPGYSIADVLVDSVSQGPITGYTFTNVQADPRSAPPLSNRRSPSRRPRARTAASVRPRRRSSRPTAARPSPLRRTRVTRSPMCWWTARRWAPWPVTLSTTCRPPTRSTRPSSA